MSAVQLCLGLLLKLKIINYKLKRDVVNLIFNFKFLINEGGLAQLARAPALHAGGQRFESVILHSVLIIVL